VSVCTSPKPAEVLSPWPADGEPCAWLDGFDDGCLLAGRDLTVVYANAAFVEWLGQPSSAVIGRPLPELVTGGAGSAACRVALAALESGGGHDTDECVGDRWFHFRARAVPAGVVIHRSDVTGRQIDESLLQTALHCRLVLEQLPTIHWTVDADLRFTRSVGAGLAGLGLKEGEATGLTLFEYLQTDDPDLLTISMHRRALAGEHIRYADCIYGRHFDIALEPLRDPSERIVGVIGLAHDTTDRHREAEERARLQEQLLLAQKRESLGVMAAGVAHDFNNLLSAIVGSAGLLLRELPPGNGTYESAALIKKAAERAAEVTRQMLVYAGKSLPARRPIDLSELVRDNMSLLTAAFPRRAVLDVRLAEGLPAVHADSGQLQQVVMNLLLNASEAAPGGGTVTLATGTGTDNGRPIVFLEVADDGCGMTPEVRSRVFDPFFTTKGRGRGLGLSAVQGIIQAHGGHIQLTSERGRGTTFRVVLPAGELPAPGR
jgi:two-component system, cell cycle sensor histidine kinase and response regulator CckA